MNTVLIYIIKVAVYLSAFYLVYSLMLSRDTTYGRNRAFILIALSLSLIFPLISFETVKQHDIQYFGKFLNEVFITAEASGLTESVSKPIYSDPIHLTFIIYISGLVLLLIKFIIDLLNLLFLILRKRSDGSRIITFNAFNTSGFSALGYIFINSRLSDDEAEKVIKHEQSHLNKNHFIDILFIECIKAIQWFNPFIHLFNRSLRAIHEYQADQGCLNSGIPVLKYQSLLLSQVFKTNAFNLTNSFSNPSLIKKRMIMMTKKRTSAIANMKLLLAIPVAGFVFLAISAYKEVPDTSGQLSLNQILTDSRPSSQLANAARPLSSTTDNSANIQSKPVTSLPSDLTVIKPESEIISEKQREESIVPIPPPDMVREETVNSENEPEPFVVVEEMPMYPGGDAALLQFIGANTIYPPSAKEKNIQGRVIVRFCVTSKGEVSLASILKGVDPELDAEALRVVNTLSLFKPGRQGGIAVPVWYMVPITFTLK